MSTDESKPADRRGMLFLFSEVIEVGGDVAAWREAQLSPRLLHGSGVWGAQRFAPSDTKPLVGTEPLHFGEATVYEGEPGLAGLKERLAEMLGSGELAPPAAVRAPLRAFAVETLVPVQEPEGADPSPDWDERHLIIAWGSHTGDDAEFERWYDTVHIPHVTTMPDIARCSRFETEDGPDLPEVDSLQLGHMAMDELIGGTLRFREELKRQLIAGEADVPDIIAAPFKTMILQPASPFVEVGDASPAARGPR